MIYKFKSAAAGDVIMAGRRGDEVLLVIGIEPAEAGIIKPAALPAALSAIEEAIAQQDTQAGHVRKPSTASWVTLRQRTRPLVEMMKRAHAENKEIVWHGV